MLLPVDVCVLLMLLLLQGEYCVQIKMDVIPGSGVAAVGAQQVRVPAQPQSLVRQVSRKVDFLGLVRCPSPVARRLLKD